MYAFGLLNGDQLIQELEAVTDAYLLYKTQVDQGAIKSDTRRVRKFLGMANMDPEIPASQRVVPAAIQKEIEDSLKLPWTEGSRKSREPGPGNQELGKEASDGK